MHAMRSSNQGLELNGVTIFQYDPDQNPTERIEARKATLKDGRWELEDAWVSAVGRNLNLYKNYLVSTYLTPTQVRDTLGTEYLDLVLGSAELHRDRRAGGTPRHAISRAVSTPAVAAVPARDHGADRGHLFAQGVPLRQCSN